MSLNSPVWGINRSRNVRFSCSSCVIYSFLSQRDLGTVNKKKKKKKMGWGVGGESGFKSVGLLK